MGGRCRRRDARLPLRAAPRRQLSRGSFGDLASDGPVESPTARTAGAVTGATMRRTVLLDLDGTLTDNHDGITRSIVHALAALGAPAPDAAALAACIGPPLRTSFARLLATTEAATVERALAPTAPATPRSDGRRTSSTPAFTTRSTRWPPAARGSSCARRSRSPTPSGSSPGSTSRRGSPASTAPTSRARSTTRRG